MAHDDRVSQHDAHGTTAKRHASPYATGGGGTVLEHAYGAVLLAALLQRSPVRGLGDDVTPVGVEFQQGANQPVDDLHVIGECPTGTRLLSVGVRRDPTIGARSPTFVNLLADYLRLLVNRREDIDADRWRLGLAVAAPHTASAEVATLAWIARRQRSNERFRAAVTTPRATTGKVRQRLASLDAAVTAAATEAGIRPGAPKLTWPLLRALRIIHLSLEGDDPTDRSRVITDLMRVTATPRRPPTYGGGCWSFPAAMPRPPRPSTAPCCCATWAPGSRLTGLPPPGSGAPHGTPTPTRAASACTPRSAPTA